MRLIRLFFLTVCVFCGTSATLFGQGWFEFRGPNGDGISSAKDLPATWSESNIAWKQELPGRGWSSPVVIGNEIWLTTAVEVAAKGEEKESKLKDAAISGLQAFSKVKLQALKIDRASGSIIKQIDLFEITDPPLIHSLNSFASPTAVIDGVAVYCNFGAFGTACLNRESGDVIWRNNELKLDHETGPGSSPIIYRDLLIIHCDGTDSQSVVALNKTSGRLVWQQKRSGEMNEKPSFKKAYSTPSILSTKNGDQLISAGADWLYAYQPLTGKEIWRLPYGKLGFSNVPRPIIGDDMMYLCTGFMRSSLLAISLKNVTDKKQLSAADIVWRYEKQVPTMPSPILSNGLIFMVSDRGIATCLDAKTGDEKWQKRLGGGFSSSPILADGKLYFGNQKGEVFVVKPNSEFELLAKNKLDSDVMATPAAVDDHLIVRTKKSLYRIQNK